MYDIYLLDANGARLQKIQSSRVSAVLTTNAIGLWRVTLTDEYNTLIKKDRMVEIWRKGQFLTGGFIRKFKFRTGETEISGPDFNYLLSGRVVAYAAGSSEADKSDYADDAIKEVIDENLGSSASAARQFDVDIQADASVGETVARAFARRKMIDVCQLLAEDSANQGTRIYFGFRPYWSPSLTLRFETKAGQWGADRSFTGQSPVIFGDAFGNIEDYEEAYDYWDEINVVYVGGQGLADDRLVVEVSDSVASTADAWARRESFLSMSNTLTSAGLTSAGYAELYNKRGLEQFSCKLLDTPLTQFGKDWELGDRVAIMQAGRKLDAVIEKVQVTLNGASEQIITVVKGNL